MLAANKNAENFNKYAIGANQEISNIDITKMICKYLDKKVPAKNSYFNQVEFVNDRLGHDLRYAIDSSYIKKTLGFKPNYNLDSGLIKTIDWYLENKEWVKRKI